MRTSCFKGHCCNTSASSHVNNQPIGKNAVPSQRTIPRTDNPAASGNASKARLVARSPIWIGGVRDRGAKRRARHRVIVGVVVTRRGITWRRWRRLFLDVASLRRRIDAQRERPGHQTLSTVVVTTMMTRAPIRECNSTGG